eukprot:3590983-Prymnesium_polylepis.1
MKDDADYATCMAVTARIGSNVLGVSCVPSRRSDRCTWCTNETSTDVVSDGTVVLRTVETEYAPDRNCATSVSESRSP